MLDSSRRQLFLTSSVWNSERKTECKKIIRGIFANSKSAGNICSHILPYGVTQPGIEAVRWRCRLRRKSIYLSIRAKLLRDLITSREGVNKLRFTVFVIPFGAK